MGFASGDRTRRRPCLLRRQHKHGRSKKLHINRLHKTCGPVNQQRHVCVERCPTDHEARGQAQRRQLRRVATELRRDHDPEAEAKHAKHGRIRTQIGHLSMMTSVRGKQNDLHAQSLEGTQVVLVSPANQPAQRRARAAELWRSVRKRTRGQANSLSKTWARVKRRRRAMECNGGRIMECHDDRKRRTRESNVELQDLEKTALSTREARGGERST